MSKYDVRKAIMRRRMTLTYAVVIFGLWYLIPTVLLTTGIVTTPNIDFVKTPDTFDEAVTLAMFLLLMPFWAAKMLAAYIYHFLFATVLGPFGFRIGKGLVFFNTAFNFALTFALVAGARFFSEALRGDRYG